MVVGGLVTQLCPTLATAWTVARWASLSLTFPRQEYWRGLHFPTPVDLPDTGVKDASPVSPALAGRFFTTELPGKPHFCYKIFLIYLKSDMSIFSLTIA